MNNTWKLSILGAVALVASSAVMAVGCTVTTTSGPLDDGGTTGDSSTGSDGGSEASTVDSGTDGPATCSATAVCPIIGSGAAGVTFDTPACGACDKCSATNCCAEATKCFTKVNGMDSECTQLFDCIVKCLEPNDAGVTIDQCKMNCRAAYPNGYTDLVAIDTCQSGDGDAGTGKCVTECK